MVYCKYNRENEYNKEEAYDENEYTQKTVAYWHVARINTYRV